jgi:hypothetical protein
MSDKTPEEWDDLEQEITGCRFGDPDNCTKENHPDCWKGSQ